MVRDRSSNLQGFAADMITSLLGFCDFFVNPRSRQIMTELTVAFPQWQAFKETVAAVAKTFGSFHRLDRFRDVCILNNDAVPKDTFGA